ncbi:hypothetical protein COCON_G00099950 [Conger conger]|uniref:T-complex-associated testis-expressed protein 1 n=1 Tax=Conger conger TaxID=82655 RepID=A0A9Q1DMT5_CONCO|nr:hypothetical protein COCON_G00099950 [Conger conger]
MSEANEGVGRPLQISPPLANQNPAADSRKMRRIIAEDPEWSLATVPLLTNLCLTHIIQNFEENPVLQALLPQHRAYVHARLSPSLPLRVTANLVSDEGFWRRCCGARWLQADPAAHAGSWKRMFLERHLQALIELFIPDVTDPGVVLEAVPHCRGFVRRLDVSQLPPPVLGEDGDEASDAGYEGPSMDHFDFSTLLPLLVNLEELHVVYRVKDCGMNFEWNLFEFTSRDCHSLAKALKSCKTLKVVRVHQSKVDDERCQVLVRSLLDHLSLEELNLSHNLIGDRGAKAIAKLLGRSRLRRLALSDNRIRGPGAQALAHAIARSASLTDLNLRLNFLGDEGGQAVANALLKNRSLVTVHLGANQMTEPTAMVLSQVLAQNRVLQDINLSCNRLGVDGGKALEEGMSHNSTMLECDVRLTDMAQESELSIAQILHSNRTRAQSKPHYGLHSP